MDGKNSRSTTIMQNLTFVTFIVSEKTATFQFLPYVDNQLASLILIIILAHIFHVSHKKQQPKTTTKKQPAITRMASNNSLKHQTV